MKKNKLVALFAGLSLAFVGSAALAAPSADTLLVAGYDSDAIAVLYGVSDIDRADADTATLDCTLNGAFVYEVDTNTDEGVVNTEGDEGATEADVIELTKKAQESVERAETTDAGAVEFFEEGLDEKELEDAQGVLYGTADAEECALTSVTIVPKGEGEVNHGTVVSTFATLYKGCILRHFAQTDWGKADSGNPDEGEVTLESIRTSCDKEKGKDRVQTAEGDDTGPSGKANASDKADKTDKANKGKGKANAPSQKDK